MPDDKVLLVCKDGKSNKYWRYEIVDDKHVNVTFGRIGVVNPTKEHTFYNVYERDKFISEKMAEKSKKGYKPEIEEKLAVDAEVAKRLGVHYKVQRFEWCSVPSDKSLALLDDYDPDQFVYVEVLNSTSKEVTYLLLNRNQAWLLDGVRQGKDIVRHDTKSHPFGKAAELIPGVRDYLRSLAAQIRQIVTQAVGALGKRKLDLGNDEPELVGAAVMSSTQQDEIVSSFSAKSGASAQVVRKFAGLGSRKLDL